MTGGIDRTHVAARLDNIDAMRAVAIAAVLLYHYTARWPLDLLRADHLPFRADLGWAGVDLFFMVSGYCILMTIERSRSLAHFYARRIARRIARLQPAYMAAIALTFATVSIFGLPGAEPSLGTAIGNLLWFDVAPGWGYVDGAYWSLVVEVQFYAMFGLIHWATRGRSPSLAWAMFAAVGAILLAPRYSGVPGAARLGDFAQWVLIAHYAPAFLVGLIAYEFRGGMNRAMFGPVLLAIVLLESDPRYAATPGLGLGLAAAALAVFRWRSLQAPRLLVGLGLISYPLYLVHQSIGLVVIRELASALPALLPRIVIAGATVIALATILHLTIELRWQRPIARVIEPLLARAGRVRRKRDPALPAAS